MFSVITSDGSLQQIELSYGQSGYTFPNYTSYHRKNLCSNIFCFDRHHELNFLVAVHKNSGTTIQIVNLERRLRLAEGHIEAGRLLAFYQVPKAIKLFCGG
ncbi:uncharacterized protein [Arachis hypogaea]|uniref:uncharacterized protein isoform X2 n=1 Tax=Arachis hypogaea TaxID=3818 RepID=UPI003B2246E8